MTRKAKFFLIFLIALIFCVDFAQSQSETENRSQKNPDEISFVELAIIAKKISDLRDLEGFYEAEEIFLRNSDNKGVSVLMQRILKSASEPIVRARVKRFLKIFKKHKYAEFPSRRLYALYFSSDPKRRKQAIEELWTLGTQKAKSLLLGYLNSDPSYEVRSRALLALANFSIDNDLLIALTIGAQSEDANFATSCLYALLRCSLERGLKILKNWRIKPKYDWQFTTAWKMQETLFRQIPLSELELALIDKKSAKIRDSLYEIIARKFSSFSVSEIGRLMRMLKIVIEKNLVSFTNAWRKLWRSIAARIDVSQFFFSLKKNKQLLPACVWRDVAKHKPSRIFKIAFGENKYYQRLAKKALIEAGRGLELLKKIKIERLFPKALISVEEFIRTIRRKLKIEIYFTEHAFSAADKIISVRFNNLNLLEALSIVGDLCALRFDFVEGRIYVYFGENTLKGFRLFPESIDSTETEKNFERLVITKALPAAKLPIFADALSKLVGRTVVLSKIASHSSVVMPSLKAGSGLFAPIKREFRRRGLDIIVRANALWIVSTREMRIFELRKQYFKKPSAKLLREIYRISKNRLYLLAELTNAGISRRVGGQNFAKLLLEFLDKTNTTLAKALFIKATRYFLQSEQIANRVLNYLESPKFLLREAAQFALSKGAISNSLLLNRYLELSLSAQVFVRHLLSKKLGEAKLSEYLAKLILSESTKNRSMPDWCKHEKALASLVFSVLKKRLLFHGVQPRCSQNLSATPRWLLYLLSIYFNIPVRISPLLSREFFKRPQLLRTTLEFNADGAELATSLKKLALKFSFAAGLKEFLPVVSVYCFANSAIAANKSKYKGIAEYLFAYPGEIESVFYFSFLLKLSVTMHASPREMLLEQLWQGTGKPEIEAILKYAGSAKTSKFACYYRNLIIKILLQLEKKIDLMTAAIARLGIRLRQLLRLEIPNIYRDYKNSLPSWFNPHYYKR